MSGPDRFDQIVNLGNYGRTRRANDIVQCRDGFELSVLAGGHSLSTPELARQGALRPTKSSDNDSDDDHPGPFTAVDVMPYGDVPATWAPYLHEDFFAHVPVEMVRQLLEAHGGEA